MCRRLVAGGGVQRLRRYAVGRVFRERSARGYHPREALECAFDIVAPRTESLWADAEAVACAARCAQALGLRVARLRLGHAELLHALLRCAGLPAERAAPLVGALRDFALGRLVRQQLQTHLATLALGGRRAAMLMRLADAELPVPDLPDLIVQVQREQWGVVLQRAARDLALLETRARALGCEVSAPPLSAPPLSAPPLSAPPLSAPHPPHMLQFDQIPITVVPLLAYGAEQHSGVFWQLVAGESSQRLRERHVIRRVGATAGARGAGGGAGRAAAGAVGFSLSLERAAALCRHPAHGGERGGAEGAPPVLVVAEGGAALARELWARGLRCTLWEGEEREARASPSGLLLRQLADTVRVDFWEGSKWVIIPLAYLSPAKLLLCGNVRPAERSAALSTSQIWYRILRTRRRAAASANILYKRVNRCVTRCVRCRAREMVLAPGDAVELVRRHLAPEARGNNSAGAAREAAGAGGAPGAGGSTGTGGGDSERGTTPGVLVAFVTGDEKLNRSYRRQIESGGERGGARGGGGRGAARGGAGAGGGRGASGGAGCAPPRAPPPAARRRAPPAARARRHAPPHSLRLCVHYRDWTLGDWIPEQIATSVESSRRTVIVLSRAFLSSYWGLIEFREAHRRAMTDGKARVMAVLVGDVLQDPRLGDELRTYLATTTYLHRDDVRFLPKLASALRPRRSLLQALRRTARPAPTSPAPLAPTSPAPPAPPAVDKLIGIALEGKLTQEGKLINAAFTAPSL
ncbi:Protein toll [Papilio xuthus]|uniref:Protein toll n=1 Tax=Papilio xuthus TaxID=66420 RepID=A0A194PFJ0_PAPXU|nr:Protein toll [Papilio xuthus]